METVEVYHGTDARVIEMTRDEREKYKEDCYLVINSLYPLFKPLMVTEMIEAERNGKKIYYNEYPLKLRYEKLLNEKGGKRMFNNLFEKLYMIDGCKNGVGLYQYNNLYVCASKRSALFYSERSYAGGEVGLVAYRLIQGAEIIGFESLYQDANVKRAADRIKEFAKEGNERPVIVTIEDADVDFLFNEDGTPLTDYVKDNIFNHSCIAGSKFRYTKPIELVQCKVEPLTNELCEEINNEEYC